MKITDLQEMWAEDSKINEHNLGQESIRTPNLHAKYLNFLSSTKLALRKAESDYYNCRRKKYRYYRGEMTKSELEDEGWSQWQGTKPLKNEMDEYLQVDSDLIKYTDKVEYHRTVVFQLEQILRSLNGRAWEIKNAIEWLKFTNGMM
jgi:hypothetical protein